MKWALGALGVIVAWLAGVAGWIAVGPAEDASDSADVAIVLGAAVDRDVPSPVFAARIDHAIALYRAGRVQGLVLTGARAPGDTLSEAAAARDYAMQAGVPGSAIAIEERSRTTHQNLVEARALMQASGAGSALIVSDPLHLRRAGLMASGLGLDARASATPTTRYRSLSTKVPFLMRELYFVHHYWALGE